MCGFSNQFHEGELGEKQSTWEMFTYILVFFYYMIGIIIITINTMRIKCVRLIKKTKLKWDSGG